MSEIRKLLNIKSDTYESSDLGITSFKDCPNKCVNGIIINPYTHKKETCSYCQEKRRDLIKYNYKSKEDGKTLEEILRLPKSFSSTSYDIDTIIPASSKKYLLESSYNDVIAELKSLMSMIKGNTLPKHSYLFNLGKKAYEGGYIYSLLASAYISGFDVAPCLSAFEIVDLRQRAERGYETKDIGVSFNDLLTKDLVVIVIEAGATPFSILSVKGLMQLRAFRELPTIIFTNHYNTGVLDLTDTVPTYNLAKYCSIEYVSKQADEQNEQPKGKPVVNNPSSMTAEQFKNLFKSS